MQCQVNPNSSSDLEWIMCRILTITSYYKHMFYVKTSSQLQNSKNPKLHLLRYQQGGKGFLIWEQSSNGVAGYQRRNLSHHSRKVRESESEVAQLCPTLCNPMDCSLSGSSVPGTCQARVLECIAISFSRGSSQPRNWTRVSYIAGRRFTGFREH